MEIQYERIGMTDLDAMADIYATYLNAGDTIRDYVEAGMKNKDFVGYKALDHGKIVGVLSGRSGIDFTYPHPEIAERLRQKFPEEKIYTPDALVVLDEYRGHPLAFELGRLLIQEVHQKGYEYLLTELWIYPNGHIPAEHVVSTWGTEVYREDIDGFYRELEKYHMECPVCGTHCSCGARILVMKTDGQIHIREGEKENEL